jgi:hypothetical protein
MHQKIQVFENEEAKKLLDYFVVYKKLQSKLDYIKCVAALNPIPNLDENRVCSQPTSLLNQTDNVVPESTIDLSQTLEK